MAHVDTPHSVCHFGIARRDITPPVGIYHRMWGAASHDQSVGIHRPLTATAMVFQQPGFSSERQVVVALDHCLLLDPEIQFLIGQICCDRAIDPGEVVITFSHTHAAGLMDPRRSDMPGGDMIAPYLEDLATKVAATVATAMRSVQPVMIVYSMGHCSLATHRDFWDDENNLIVCGFNPEQKADDTLLVAKITDENEQLVATIVNYACHPTTLAWDNRLISSDFPGAMRETMERVTGVVSVFLQGASGDLGPRDGFVGETEVADRNGRQLGYAALAALELAPPSGTKYVYQGPVVSGATIGVWKHTRLASDEIEAKRHWEVRRWTVDLPYREGLRSVRETQKQLDHWRQEEQLARSAGDQAKAADARAMVERMRRWLTRFANLPAGQTFPFPITLWRTGDAIWLAVEGEPYNLLQRRLRERFPKTPIMVMVLANGSRAWYLPTQESYGKGIYQESMANLQEGSLEQLIELIGAEVSLLLDE